MTWEIVVGITILLGAAISICTIVSNNTKAMTEVKCSIDALNETVSGQKDDMKDMKDTIGKHETRIKILEDHESTRKDVKSN